MKPNENIEKLLLLIAEEIEVPESAYEQAAERYRAVGEWLCKDDSPLSDFNPEIYPQGSFALGTATKPLNRDDLDVDAVVLLSGDKTCWSASSLKRSVGDRLKSHGTYERMLATEGRRCWTLTYAKGADSPGFHLDLLPSIPANRDTALFITNKEGATSYTWRDSDPKGFAEWFLERTATNTERDNLNKLAGIEPIRDFGRQSHLQRAVRLLKRIRDVMFQTRPDAAPISVIITTLAAKAYQGEESLSEALFGIADRLESVAMVHGKVAITNPTREEEDFADRWNGDKQKIEGFVEWLTLATSLRERLEAASTATLPSILEELLGVTTGSKVQEKVAALGGFPSLTSTLSSTILSPPVAGAMAVAKASHREPPPWPVSNDVRIRLTCQVTGGSGGRRGELSSGQAVLKHMKLLFTAKSAEFSFGDTVYWQVTNTGAEAARSDQLRGNFQQGAFTRTENTQYTGYHSVQCFLVRNGRCIGTSQLFIVNILA